MCVSVLLHEHRVFRFEILPLCNFSSESTRNAYGIISLSQFLLIKIRLLLQKKDVLTVGSREKQKQMKKKPSISQPRESHGGSTLPDRFLMSLHVDLFYKADYIVQTPFVASFVNETIQQLVFIFYFIVGLNGSHCWMSLCGGKQTLLWRLQKEEALKAPRIGPA